MTRTMKTVTVSSYSWTKVDTRTPDEHVEIGWADSEAVVQDVECTAAKQAPAQSAKPDPKHTGTLTSSDNSPSYRDVSPPTDNRRNIYARIVQAGSKNPATRIKVNIRKRK